MITESFHFLNGPLKGKNTLTPGQYLEMYYDGEHLVLTDEYGEGIPDELPKEQHIQITWALVPGERVLLVTIKGDSLLYLRASCEIKAYSFLTKL